MPPEEKHVLSVLKTTMRVLGFSNRDLERELKVSGSYLSRVFSGDLDLRFSHVLDLSRAMGLAPEEILRLIYPPEPGPKSPAAARLKAYLDSLAAADDPRSTPVPTRREIEMGEAIERVLAEILGQLGAVPLFAGITESRAPLVETVAEPLPLPMPRKRRSRKSGA
jgi:hypothetical protein